MALTENDLLQLAHCDRARANALRDELARFDGDTSSYVINVKEYGAKGDGNTNDLPAILLAESAGVASGTKYVLFFPPGEYILPRNGGNEYSWDVASSNVVLLGVKGQSWLKHPSGMPNTSVALLRVDNKKNVTICDLGFDGNWGNAVTTITSASNGAALPQATVNVESTAGFPSSGTFKVVLTDGPQTVTYTGKTATSFTGCTGGTGTLFHGRKVGLNETNDGINHVTQTDPKNYLLMVRGARDLLVDNCLFRQAYGDMIWVGYSSADGNIWSQNIHIRNCTGDISGRDGIALAQACDGIYLDNCQFRNIKAQAFDTEPVDQPVRNVHVSRCFFDTWWAPSLSGIVNAPVSICGGASTKQGPHAFARSYRFSDNVIHGSCIVQMCEDIEMRGNQIICDYAASSYAPILVQMVTDGVRIENNFIYDRTADGTAGSSHRAAIDVEVYSVGKYNGQPAGVHIRRNRILARNGHAGILVNGAGGGAYDTAITQSDGSGTATSISGTSVGVAGATWTSNQWSGWMVRRGTAWATITSNTVNTLTLDTPMFFSSAWFDARGNPVAIPAVGAIQITTRRQAVTVEDNDIDCSNDGYGAGGAGIWIAGGRPGTRAVVQNNRIRNAVTDGILIEGANAPDRAMPLVEVSGNKIVDDQLVPTCTNGVRFINPYLITKLILRNNSTDGVTNPTAGLTTGTWMANDGYTQEWAGYGSPEGVVTAKVGTTFRRLDGGAGTTLYIKESGAGNTGWAAK